MCFYEVVNKTFCFTQFHVAGDGRIVLEDETSHFENGVSTEENGVPSKCQRTATYPVDLELEVVLGKMPQKVQLYYFVLFISVKQFLLALN